MPKNQQPKAALPEGELRREKVADAKLWADEISSAVMKFDDMPGLRSKLIKEIPAISGATLYKVFEWASDREKIKKETSA